MENTLFLDSNVIANWILIKDIFSTTKEQKDEIMEERFERISYSYALIEALMKTDEYDVKTCTLAIGEVFHVVYNEILSLKLYRSGIPLTVWSKLRRRYDLDEENSLR